MASPPLERDLLKSLFHQNVWLNRKVELWLDNISNFLVRCFFVFQQLGFEKILKLLIKSFNPR